MYSQGCTATKMHSGDWNFGDLTLELVLLTTMFSCYLFRYLETIFEKAFITPLFLSWSLIIHWCLANAFSLLESACLPPVLAQLGAILCYS